MTGTVIETAARDLAYDLPMKRDQCTSAEARQIAAMMRWAWPDDVCCFNAADRWRVTLMFRHELEPRKRKPKKRR